MAFHLLLENFAVLSLVHLMQLSQVILERLYVPELLATNGTWRRNCPRGPGHVGHVKMAAGGAQGRENLATLQAQAFVALSSGNSTLICKNVVKFIHCNSGTSLGIRGQCLGPRWPPSFHAAFSSECLASHAESPDERSRSRGTTFRC